MVERDRQKMLDAIDQLRESVAHGDVDTVLITVGSQHGDGNHYSIDHFAAYIGERVEPRNHIVDLALRTVRAVTCVDDS